MHHMYFGGGIFRWFMGIFHLALPILAVILLFSLLTGRRSHSYFDSYRRDPMDILRERYARGEISREEFMRMRSELRP